MGDTGPVKRVSYGGHRARIDLAAALPLDTPLSVLIDPANACTFACVFCPTGKPDLLAAVGRPKGVMAFDLFEKIVDDLAQFPQPIKSLHLYKDGEPLVNQRLADMVRLVKARGVARYVETTTNGGLLTPGLAAALLDAGLDGLRVSVYGTDEASMAAATGRRGSYAAVLANVQHLNALNEARGRPLHLHCKLLDLGDPASAKARHTVFLSTFGPISDSVYVHARHGIAMAAPGFARAPDRRRLVCSEPFIKLAINFDGQVSICCADWAMRLVIGDVRRDHLVDLWHGERLFGYRMVQLNGRRRELTACRDCDYVTTLPADTDLDAAAVGLAEAYRARRGGRACER